MGYTAIPTYTTGDLITAAHGNTYWRDNIAYLYAKFPVSANNLGSNAVTTAKILDANVTPAKTSFFDDVHIYEGRITSEGESIKLPSGWSCSKLATGTYKITHNIGNQGYTPIVTAKGRVSLLKTKAFNYIEVYTTLADGTLSDAELYFIIIED
jgi:hypothetical protein